MTINHRNNNQSQEQELINPPIITHAKPFFHSAPAPEPTTQLGTFQNQ
jgi:hypothetical protein